MVKWSKQIEESFAQLKRALTLHPVLVAPDFKKSYIVHMDASEVGLGVVLSQTQEREEHPVVYIRRRKMQSMRKITPEWKKNV